MGPQDQRGRNYPEKAQQRALCECALSTDQHTHVEIRLTVPDAVTAGNGASNSLNGDPRCSQGAAPSHLCSGA